MSDLDNLFDQNKQNYHAVSQPDAATDKAIDMMMEEAKSFHNSKHETRKKLLTVAWCVAGGLGFIALTQAVALTVLMPLKRTEPILITTYKDGHAEIIRDFSQPLVFEESVDEYFLREYVTNRETYDYHKLQYLVDYTEAWSAPHVYKEFYNFTTMPNSSLQTLKEKARIDVEVTSVNLNKDAGMATIRLTKTPKNADGSKIQSVPPTYWVAELKYQLNYEQNHKKRAYNPFGYEVTSYTLIQDRTRG